MIKAWAAIGPKQKLQPSRWMSSRVPKRITCDHADDAGVCSAPRYFTPNGALSVATCERCVGALRGWKARYRIVLDA
jgi:hypothetical protein